MTGPAYPKPYVSPPTTPNIDSCTFYHVTDLPGIGTTDGFWDLRGREAAYLGETRFSGQRVLEIGPASGHLSFWLEAQGAEVVAFDLGPSDQGTIIPYAGVDLAAVAAVQASDRQRVANAWWLAHHALGSKVRRAEGTVYDLPQSLGHFDVVTLGAVLLHLRDPVGALIQVGAFCRTIVVADVAGAGARWWRRLARRHFSNHLNFLPDPATRQPLDAWWALNPEVVGRMLAVLGFTSQAVTYHRQRYLVSGEEVPTFTVVASRRNG